LAAAQQLARKGHDVTVFEKDERIGGLLRYGIPDFKLDKGVIDRRLEQMKAEGVRFEAGVKIGEDLSSRYLQRTFDATCLAMGAGTPRDLPVKGRDLGNVHFAMEFLGQQNQVVAGDEIPENDRISAAGKVVVVIGGGDTGSDCVGTSNRHGAKAIHQFEIMPKPPEGVNDETPWPVWPQILRTSSSHKEGCKRRWSVLTKELVGKKGVVTHLKGCEVEWYKKKDGQHAFKEVKGYEFTMKVDLVLLAMGFVHVEQPGIVTDLGVGLDHRGNVRKRDMHMTSVPGVFACGDTTRGASLVVHAINEGRLCAAGIDRWLKTQG
jgi:NAD(P)H-dependent glutamate synthase small subunit